jgi:hypothetical protein
MLPCTSGSVFDVCPENPMSLQRCAHEEAQRHKWLRSERAGRDLGELAIKEWIRAHWIEFLRHCWLEHLRGKTLFVELRAEDYGLLLREFRDSRLLVPILDRLQVLQENLDIINWAIPIYSKEEMEEIRAILTMLDVNSCRLRANFDPRQIGMSSGTAVA